MNLRAFYLRNKFWLIDYLNGSPIGNPYREIKYIIELSYEDGLPYREKTLNDFWSIIKDTRFTIPKLGEEKRGKLTDFILYRQN